MQAIAVPRSFLGLRRKDAERYKFDSVAEFLASKQNVTNHYGADCVIDNLRINCRSTAENFRDIYAPAITFMLEDRDKDPIEIVHLRGNLFGAGWDSEAERMFWNRLLKYENNSFVNVRFKIRGIVRPYYRLADMTPAVQD